MNKFLFVIIRIKSVWGRNILGEDSPASILERNLLQALGVETQLLPGG